MKITPKHVAKKILNEKWKGRNVKNIMPIENPTTVLIIPAIKNLVSVLESKLFKFLITLINKKITSNYKALFM